MTATTGKPHNIWIFLAAIVIPNVGGWIGVALWQDRDWFENLQHPSWRPPNWLFPVVWTPLYVLMGVASYYVWKHGEGMSRLWIPLGVYCLQLILNWIWTPLFFVMHLILLSLVDIIILWILVVGTIILFWRVKRLATFLLVPYLIWITVATVLNANYLYLNPDA